ncbi:MAG: hypothetical protein AAGD92_11130 [Pseudomonadota bacterium]
MRFIFLLAGFLFIASLSGAAAQSGVDGFTEENGLQGNSDAPPGDPVTAAAARLRAAIQRIDPAAEFFENGANFSVVNTPVTLVYDLAADRMRLVAPVAELASLDEAALMRLMQANFDSALDARYAAARGVLWSTFIHQLSILTPDEFGSGLGQTVNLVQTYGSSYSSGAIVFGGGDSAEEQRELIEELQDKSRDI